MTKSPFDVDFLRVDFEKSNFFGECMLKKVGKIMGPRARLFCRDQGECGVETEFAEKEL